MRLISGSCSVVGGCGAGGGVRGVVSVVGRTRGRGGM